MLHKNIIKVLRNGSLDDEIINLILQIDRSRLDLLLPNRGHYDIVCLS